ncbi:MAG: hypothetical protein CMG74_13190 [Candidatus Marinimicrobia bacterium]|nr:hypothetical protein [Candidatus Neomarinimicrobiota bacterium]|tara:strand:+ start:64253 stop:64972 length:720 start_codon:yes stop_codon:yes gene_type:complete
MNIAIQLAKDISRGVPGKNQKIINGLPLYQHTLNRLLKSNKVDEIFVSTDSIEIASNIEPLDLNILMRSGEIAHPDCLTENVLSDSLEQINKKFNISPDIVCVVFSNAPTFDPTRLDKAIEILEKTPELDSVFSVCEYNMFTPIRARKINKDGISTPFCNLEQFGDITNANRDNIGNCYFADLTIQVTRTHWIENVWDGPAPIRWMGSNSYAMKGGFGFDIDAEWQWPVIENWLNNNPI